MKLNIAAYYPKGTNGVSEILPLLLSSGSLSVPLVSSVDVNENREIMKKWWDGRDLSSHNQIQEVSVLFYNQELHLVQLHLGLPQKQVVSAAISAKFDRPVDVGDAMWLLSMWLHYLAPRCPGSSLSFSLACHQRWYRSCWYTGQEEENTGSEPQWFLLSGNHEPPLLSLEVFVPLMLLHSCINVPEEQRLWFNCKG